MRRADAATKPPIAPRTAGDEPLLTQYLSHLANERRLSANTVSGYAHDVRALLELAAGAPLDIVIANAGIAPMADENAWQDVIDVNLTGVFLLSSPYQGPSGLYSE